MTSPLKYGPVHLTEGMMKFQNELESWTGTPYRLFSQAKGAGVDCVRFVCAMGDFAWKRGEKTHIPRVHGDTSMHNPALAKGVMKFLMQSFNYRAIPEDDKHVILPGDVIVCGHQEGGPGHAILVGVSGLYHATQESGVCRVGMGLAGMKHFATLRRVID